MVIENNMHKPIVSVLMPSLNVIDYIDECILSVINQSLQDIEIICIDAGSTDGTLGVLEKYAQIDKRIRVIHSPIKSYGYQMNLGLELATGEYIGIVETDDRIKKDMFENLYHYAEMSDLDIVFSNCYYMTGNKDNYRLHYTEINKDRYHIPYKTIQNPSHNLYVFAGATFIWNGLYKSELIKKNSIRFNETPGASYQDNGFWFMTICNAQRVMFIEDAYYLLRRDNPNSSVKSKDKVYFICNEYDFIRDQLHRLGEKGETFIPACEHARMRNYRWNYQRIADEYKDEFAKRVLSDYRKAKELGEIDKALFSDDLWDSLIIIDESLVAYKAYMKKCHIIKHLERKIEREEARIKKLTEIKREYENTILFKIKRRLRTMIR